MAWYLNEVVTDLSPVQAILGLYQQTGTFREETFHDQYQGQLTGLLRQATFHSDHIDHATIPAIYENDEYKWLAAGYHELLLTLELAYQYYDEVNDLYGYELTATGEEVLSQTISLPELMQRKLPEWVNDRRVKPYPEIIKVLTTLKERDLYPCGGLLLLEVLIILKSLNHPDGFIEPYRNILERRRAFYALMAGELTIDLVQYSDFLWEAMSQDPTQYHAANYPTRATIHLMMYGGDLCYGPVPDELFGLAQYITLAR
jgi:hypothetical protein